MRNAFQDEIEMEERRQKLLEAGFRLFSRYSIESVKLTEIAEESGVGIATLYRYFENKSRLVIEIGIRTWTYYFEKVQRMFDEKNGNSMNGEQVLEFFLDCFIDLYQNHKDILSFNRNFSTYVKHSGCTAEQMRSFNESVSTFARKFHQLFVRSQNDGTVEISMPENRTVVNLLYIMLSVTERYTEGLVFPSEKQRDMTEELLELKSMIMKNYKAEKA
ncbi:MAG: TetR/AcrR family transcriptional regulator [Clostridia bacterium]|nr:TetR/AcrR family transcriptional regulator [Clostridia bacterium]